MLSLIYESAARRIAAQSDVAQLSRAETQRRNATAQHAWSPATHPAWLTEEAYSKEIQPQLSRFANGVIASTLQVSMSYAADVRKGRRRPHQRHWQALAQLVGTNTSVLP